MIDDNFLPSMVKWGPDNTLLYKAQKTHMSIVLERVLQTADGKRFNRKHMKEPREVCRLHEEHQMSSATNDIITFALTQELANLKVSDFTSSTVFLDEFDSKLAKFNKLFDSSQQMPDKMSTSFLLQASHGNTELRNAWATKRTICLNTIPVTVPTYTDYFEYLMFHSKQLEASIVDNTSTRKVNSSETDYLSQNSPSDPDYQQANDLSNYMGIQDADMVQYTLECNKAMNDGKPPPPQKT